MTDQMGLLLVTMEPPASLEEEFNDWYDLEHFPQRCGLPGFLTGTRWRCLDGWPKWLALYDLTSLAALETGAYRAVSGVNSTPWSRRLLPRMIGRERVAARQLAPGQAVLADASDIASLVVARYRTDVAGAADFAAALPARTQDLDGHLQTRIFASPTPAATDIWAIAAFDRTVSTATLQTALGAVGGKGARSLNLYVPYFRG